MWKGGLEKEFLNYHNDVNKLRRKWHGCGAIETAEGQKEIVVVGGEDTTMYETTLTTEIFSMEDMEWRMGPDLPEPIQTPVVVQKAETFVILSGRKDGFDDDFTDSIYEFDQVNM